MIETAPSPEAVETLVAPTICACGHPLDKHDPIAARYCRATANGELPRGCICAAK
jgi:hypothetical protein